MALQTMEKSFIHRIYNDDLPTTKRTMKSNLLIPVQKFNLIVQYNNKINFPNKSPKKERKAKMKKQAIKIDNFFSLSVFNKTACFPLQCNTSKCSSKTKLNYKQWEKKNGKPSARQFRNVAPGGRNCYLEFGLVLFMLEQPAMRTCHTHDKSTCVCLERNKEKFSKHHNLDRIKEINIYRRPLFSIVKRNRKTETGDQCWSLT